MAIRFNKSIKIGKYLRLNISKSGISATVGKKGASINIGSKGTYVNLSPAAAGLGGTGVSYRKKIGGGYANAKKKNKKNTKNDIQEYNQYDETIQEVEVQDNNSLDTSVVDQYNQNLEAKIHLHKYTDNVMSKKQFKEFVDSLESAASKELYQLSIEGDEDVVESLISTYMNNLALAYEIRVNYELEDNILYVDLDLPEIEDMEKEYPAVLNNKIVYKKKKATELKEEYARLVMSIGVFLSANFFNLSSYIDQIVLSAFTTARNNHGDLVDMYLYSVKYTREVFEKTNLEKLEDLYSFILGFENRINMSNTYSFKPIKPYEMESVVKTNALIDDAVLGLKELGYKVNDINAIVDKLSEYEFETSSEYLKEGLRLLQEKR